ncbi:MAG: alpha/beta hydrolase [Candidatus Moraniibacteriota bacterium]
MENISSKTILFITGAFVTHKGWEPWQAYLESKGYKTFAPPWPLKDGEPAALRAQHPHSPIASLRLAQVIEHYKQFALSLPEKPILIGHSAGGFMVQALLQQDAGAAGIAIHPFPPQGVIPTELSFYRAGTKALGLFSSAKKTYLMSLRDWQYAFTNGMSLEEQKESYAKNVIPESKRIARDGLTSAAHIDFQKPHAPLLITSGSRDNILPASLNYRNFKRYPQNNGSITEYKEFPGRNHFVLGQSTWKEDADYILSWLASH